MDITLETILRPAFVPAERISEQVYNDNLAFAKENAHNEAVFRKMYASADRVASGKSTEPADAVDFNFLLVVLSMGPLFARQLMQFAPPKRIAASKEDEIPTWVNAARRAFAKTARDAIYAAQASIHAGLADKSIVSQGLPEGLSAEEFFWETVRACGTPSTTLKVDDVEYPGLSEDMKGSTCCVQFGWYANSWRTLSKGAKEKIAARAAAKTNGAKPAAEAPAPDAK